MNKKTAIILGATGLTGSLLLKRLVTEINYSAIKLFSRRTTGISSPKVKEYIGDVLQLENFKEDFFADVVFCCIGTTSSKTKDRNIYKAIDYGIPVKAAKMARENKIPTFLVISTMGASAESKVFYSRTKGEMEQAVLDQKIPNTFILRPSLILGERGERRIGESIGASFMKLASPLLRGKAEKYRAIEAATIAAAMIKLAESDHGSQIVPSDVIQKYGKGHNL
jgi:uncharacterized protein YbjT (DUF2867 family)